jgi:GNAT superfamily N-acetyltransferase
VQIQRFDATADQDELHDCYLIVNAANQLEDAERPGSFAAFARWWKPSGDNNRSETWLATDEVGDPAGCYLLTLPPENPDLARCAVFVAPSKRRTGIGAALLEHCKHRARLTGRTRLASFARDDSPGAAFAIAAGASSGQDHVTGEYLDDVAELSVALADAPRDAGVEPETWDAGRVARLDRAAIGAGLRLYSVGASHLASGRLAALTQLATDPEIPGWASQSITAVRPGHRGHRLGLLVKVAMLELLRDREPGVRHVSTGNAAANEHMIAINARLGFEISAVSRFYELRTS